MTSQVLIVQPTSQSTSTLADLFKERQTRVWRAASPEEAYEVIRRRRPDLLVVDLHLLENGWQEALPSIGRQHPQIKLLFTTHYPDPQAETRVQAQYGTKVFLRQPFTRSDLEQALRLLDEDTATPQESTPAPPNLPRIRIPMRLKITLPYALLALILAMAAAYIVSQVVLDSIEERFTNQLIEAGTLTQDWMVQEENRLLDTLRLVAYTEGLAEAVAVRDADALFRMALPVAVNYQEDAVEILDPEGISLLSLRHIEGGSIEDYDVERGEGVFGQWLFVQEVLDQQAAEGRDKTSGLVSAAWGDYFYVAGPILDANETQVGVILIGKSVANLVRQIRQDTLVHTTVYDLEGQVLASTLLLLDETRHFLPADMVTAIFERRHNATPTRRLKLASVAYTEIIGPWRIQRRPALLTRTSDENIPGLVGAALPEAFLVNPSRITQLQVFVLTTVAFLSVIALGLYLANRITGPLLQVVDASTKVARGDLDVRVNPTGNDEVAILAHSFNHMVAGLQEGSIYRDLLGRTVSPEVRAELRQRFASGELRLEGQGAVATVLVSDIHGFTTLSEAEDSTSIMAWLNEYFKELIPIITAHGGVISTFEGDAVVAFFGILPRALPAGESAYRACQAALAILQALERLNSRRADREDPPLVVGLGINTGPVTAGALGSSDRLHYTIIGDTVNAATHLEGFTRQLGQESSAIISQHTLFALGERRRDFDLESMGIHTIRGKMEKLLVYGLKLPAEGA